MAEIILQASGNNGIDDIELREALEKSIQTERASLKKVLLIPPDNTRANSGAGKITSMYYEMLKDACVIDIMPALGTHVPMSRQEIKEMFGNGIPQKCFINHNCRAETVKIGKVPQQFIREVSGGLMDEPVDVEVNKRLLDKTYDLIISIGQVVPHEVAGMANYSKNIFIGCGGISIINKTHMLGAVYGMENIMGRDHSPVRKVLDYAEENFIKDIPLKYILTVTTVENGTVRIHGLFAGRGRRVFEAAVELGREKNLTFLEKPLKKVVVFLDEKEFKSTWLGNKAIYRTRMAIADGGELLVIAPGVERFGEDVEIDKLIRKYGYIGRLNVLESCRQNADLRENLSVAAHLIHGSSDGRFAITYATQKLSKAEIESVNFHYIPINEAYMRYNPEKLQDGFNIMKDGEEIYYISNPALGLWIDKSRIGN